MKKTIRMSLLFAVLISLAFTAGPAVGEDPVKIGITQIVTHPSLDEIRAGVVDTLAKEGYVDGKNLEIDYQNPEGDMSLVKTIASKFTSAPKKDIIVSITTPSTQGIVSEARGKGIPVVFTAVTDPVLAGIVPSWENPCEPGLQITGISDYIPVKPQLELIQAVCPEAKSLGMVYNAGDESNTKTVEEMKALAEEQGLKVVEASVTTSAETNNAAKSLVGRADVMWSPMCNTTVSGLEGVLAVCEEEDIPYFAPDSNSVKRGGLACVYYNNRELGEQCAEKVVRILKGEDPCRIPVTTYKTEKMIIAVNPDAAKAMGVTIPASVMKGAAIYHTE
jgi:putative tryptophan/tyrosine transport system substrate-binding protein